MQYISYGTVKYDWYLHGFSYFIVIFMYKQTQNLRVTCDLLYLRFLNRLLDSRVVYLDYLQHEFGLFTCNKSIITIRKI